jgi:hypothetical protein
VFPTLTSSSESGNWSKLVMNANSAPEITPPFTSGKVIFQNVARGPAPSDRAASSSARSNPTSTADTVRKTYGSATSVWAMNSARMPLVPMPVASTKISNAMPVRIAGNCSGATSARRKSSRKRPEWRTTYMAAIVPRIVVTAVTSAASLRLKRKLRTNGWVCAACTNQRSEMPSGGKRR